MMAASPLYSAASPSLSWTGIIVSVPSVMLSWRRVVWINVDDSLSRFFGRNLFSRISSKWTGSTVGKRICSDEMTGERGVGLPSVVPVARPGVEPGRRSSSCLIMRFSRTSIWSAGSVAARVEARALPAVDASGAVDAGASGPSCIASGGGRRSSSTCMFSFLARLVGWPGPSLPVLTLSVYLGELRGSLLYECEKRRRGFEERERSAKGGRCSVRSAKGERRRSVGGVLPAVTGLMLGKREGAEALLLSLPPLRVTVSRQASASGPGLGLPFRPFGLGLEPLARALGLGLVLRVLAPRLSLGATVRRGDASSQLH